MIRSATTTGPAPLALTGGGMPAGAGASGGAAFMTAIAGLLGDGDADAPPVDAGPVDAGPADGDSDRQPDAATGTALPLADPAFAWLTQATPPVADPVLPATGTASTTVAPFAPGISTPQTVGVDVAGQFQGTPSSTLMPVDDPTSPAATARPSHTDGPTLSGDAAFAETIDLPTAPAIRSGRLPLHAIVSMPSALALGAGITLSAVRSAYASVVITATAASSPTDRAASPVTNAGAGSTAAPVAVPAPGAQQTLGSERWPRMTARPLDAASAQPTGTATTSAAPREAPVSTPAIVGDGVQEHSSLDTRRPASASGIGLAPVLPQVPAAPAPLAGTTAPAFQIFGAMRAATARDDKPEPLTAAAPTFATPVEPRHAVAATGDAQQAPLDMSHGRWPHAMIDRIEALRDAANETDTRIRLAPDALGSIDVSVKREGDTLHVRFAAEQATTATLIQDAQPRLAAIARERGLTLGQSAVETGTGQGASQQRRSDPQSHQPPAPRAALDDDTDAAATGRLA